MRHAKRISGGDTTRPGQGRVESRESCPRIVKLGTLGQVVARMGALLWAPVPGDPCLALVKDSRTAPPARLWLARPCDGARWLERISSALLPFYSLYGCVSRTLRCIHLCSPSHASPTSPLRHPFSPSSSLWPFVFVAALSRAELTSFEAQFLSRCARAGPVPGDWVNSTGDELPNLSDPHPPFTTSLHSYNFLRHNFPSSWSPPVSDWRRSSRAWVSSVESRG
jgi:hypothetical protein